MELNEGQIKAINHKDGAMLVLAGPGSGKTTVIIQRVKNLIEKYKVNPFDILVISFTKASAEEMKRRFESITDNRYNVSFSTFHSFFFRVIRASLGINLESVLGDIERNKIIGEIVSKNTIISEPPEVVANDISYVKNELMKPEYFITEAYSNEDFVRVYNLYEQYKEKNDLIDFDDMQIMCYNVFKENKEILDFWQNKCKYILIDEFQDINNAQYEIMRLLRKDNKNIFVVGDDDQSIYGFRGARPQFMLEFPNDFENADKVTLNVNYRSTDEIIKLSNTIIQCNEKRYEKNIIGTDRSGKKPTVLRYCDIEAEASGIGDKILKISEKGIPLEEIAIIYRNNNQSRAFIDSFMKKNIPYQLKDTTAVIYDHWIMKDIASYFRLSKNVRDDDAFINIVNKPSRFIKKDYIAKAMQNQKNEALIYKMLVFKELAPYQRERIDELIYHLKILGKKKPKDAINYIRKTIGYDEYIRNFAQFTNTSEIGFMTILDELCSASEPFESFKEFIEHGQRFSKEARENLNPIKSIEKGRIVLTTMHSAKGLEFDTVFVASAVNGIIPYVCAKTPDEIEEERRLFYVALTRAKNMLYVSIINSRYNYDMKPTMFLKKYMPKAK